MLPNDYSKFATRFGERRDKGQPNLWICKPAGSSRGRGIGLFSDLHALSYDQRCVSFDSLLCPPPRLPSSAVVQRYVDPPYLVNGYKVDLRLYVLVVSFKPLIVYIYKDGLARFATEPCVPSRPLAAFVVYLPRPSP